MHVVHSTAGIILAAGESKRMGEPKALLTFANGATLLERQVGLLDSVDCERIVVVVGAHAREIRERHPDLNVDWVENTDWKKGQFSSLQAGLREIAANQNEGVLLLPVDVVGIAASTLKALIETALFNTHLRAIVPEYNDHGGHPIYLAKHFFESLIDLDPADEDARLDVQLRETRDVMRLPVADRHIVRNINTPGEWEIYRESAV